MIQYFIFKVIEQPLDRTHRPFGQGAKTTAGDIAELFSQQFNMFFCRLADLKLFEQPGDIRQPVAAGGAPAAALAGEEAVQVEGHRDHAGLFIKDGDAGGAEPAVGLGDGFEIKLHIEMAGGQVRR